MRLSKLLAPEYILLDLKPGDKWSLLEKMSEVAASHPVIAEAELEVDEVHQAVLGRERQMSTGVGNGFAFPHARLPGLRGCAAVIAILRDELDFESVDGKPVRVAFLALSPEENPTIAIKIMSQITRLFASPDTGEHLLTAGSVEAVREIFRGTNFSLDVAITARDIMSPPQMEILPDTPLKEVTRMMSRYGTNAAPVQDKDGAVVGEITCDRLFHFGLPDFFSQLKSVAFISEFDPFEKYFFEEAHCCAKDVMEGGFSAMSPEATLLEIVFALTVQRHPMVYVVDGGRLAGVIDQSSVLNKIINF